MDAGRALLDIFAPAACPGCGGRTDPSPAGARDAHTPPATLFCFSCTRQLERLTLPDLGRAKLAAGVVAVAAYAYAGPIASAIRDVKAAGRHAAGRRLGALLRARLGLPFAGVVMTWVPSTPTRLRERGFELPRLLAGRGAVPLLRCVGDRPDQTGLDPAARRLNPVGSFAAPGRAPPAVVLVDDVRTTGATATAAAAALQEAGARRVLVATLAVAGRG